MRRLVFTFGLVVLAGCVTPSIPIPPPDPTRMDLHFTVVSGQSTAQFNYPPDQHYIGCVGYLYNRTLGQGVIRACNPDGSVGPAELKLSLGDELVFSVQVSNETDSTCVVAQEGTQDPNAYCQ